MSHFDRYLRGCDVLGAVDEELVDAIINSPDGTFRVPEALSDHDLLLEDGQEDEFTEGASDADADFDSGDGGASAPAPLVDSASVEPPAPPSEPPAASTPASPAATSVPPQQRASARTPRGVASSPPQQRAAARTPQGVSAPSESPAKQASPGRASPPLRTSVRGGALSFTLPSPLPGVSDDAWTRFALAVRTAPVGAVSASNALGMFELKPRRLADLGLVENIACTRGESGRIIWVGDFVPPLTARLFLVDPALQYQTFSRSMLDYAERVRKGSIPSPSGDTTLSGALAILHRCGPSGLASWKDESKRFPDTVALYERANGLF